MEHMVRFSSSGERQMSSFLKWQYFKEWSLEQETLKSNESINILPLEGSRCVTEKNWQTFRLSCDPALSSSSLDKEPGMSQLRWLKSSHALILVPVPKYAEARTEVSLRCFLHNLIKQVRKV